MANEITKVVADQVADAVVEEVVKETATKLPAKVSMNLGAVALGAGIAVSAIGTVWAGIKFVKYIKKTRAEKKAAQEAEGNPES